MSLNMYLGEVQSQTQSMNAMCTATIQGMEQVINSIDAFMFDAVLQGQTYDSAKAFFAQTFRPLAQGIIYLCEELIRQNDAFPNDFQSKVASTDVIEQEIEEQMRGIDQTKAGIEVISNTLPGMQAMMGIFDMMKQKLQEKLNHLREFNFTSSSNYDTALQLAASIAKGLAEVQSGKGFSPVSGTFSTQGLNMEWTGPIQKISEDKARQAEEESKKDESLFDQFKDAAEDGIEVAKNIFGLYHSYREGKREAVIDELKGLANTILHPIDSIESAMYALSHLDETYNAIKQAISNSWNQDVVNGDWNSRAKWFGNVEAQVELAAVQLVAGTKGADKVSKLGTFSKSGEVSKIRESVNLIQRVKNVMDSDKYRQFVDRLYNLLMPKDEFALAGANVVDSFSDSDVFKQIKEKLPNYQFFKGEGTTKDIGKNLQKESKNIRNNLDEFRNNYKKSDEYLNLSNSKKKIINRKLDKLGAGNVATAEVDISGIKKDFKAHSQIHSSDSLGYADDFSITPSEKDRVLTNYVKDVHDRYNDTEAKILEDIASKIKDPNIKGEINLFSELDCCQSCTNLIFEFREKFPNIKVNVITNNTLK